MSASIWRRLLVVPSTDIFWLRCSCRSAIEAATKDRLKKEGFAGELCGLGTLDAVLRLAFDKNVMDKVIWEASEDIRKRANRAVHSEGLPGENDCMMAYDITRGILQHLYE